MTLNINLLDCLWAATFFVAGALSIQYAWPKAFPPPASCHDEVYVFPKFEDDEPENRITRLPARRLRFTCPHADQKLEAVGGGALTCKCYGRY